MMRPNALKGNDRIGHYKSITYGPTDWRTVWQEIWVRQQPPLVVDVLVSCFDVIHDFYAFYIISAHEILNFVHFFTKASQMRDIPTDRRTDGRMDGHTLL